MVSNVRPPWPKAISASPQEPECNVLANGKTAPSAVPFFYYNNASVILWPLLVCSIP